MDKQNVVCGILFSPERNGVQIYATWMKLENMLGERSQESPHHVIPFIQIVLGGKSTERKRRVAV